MNKKLIIGLTLSTMITASYFNFEEIKPKIIMHQITQTEIPNHENNSLSHKIKKQDKNTYHIIRLDKNSQYEIKIKTSNESKYLEELIDDDIIASINASFFTKDRVIGLVRTNGQNETEHQKIKGSGYFVIEQGIPNIIKEIDDTLRYETILQSFPIIKYEGEPTKIKNGKRSYRSAIAIDYENNTYLIATNTHPLKQNKVTMTQFQEFIKTQNYKHVLNLDGGKSTQIHYKISNQENREENKNYYMRNHRRIKNAIIITEK